LRFDCASLYWKRLNMALRRFTKASLCRHTKDHFRCRIRWRSRAQCVGRPSPEGRTIETLFANLKTNVFNLEDTHITDLEWLLPLLAVLALTVTFCVKAAAAAARLRPIPIKKHGRRAQSGLVRYEKSRLPQTPHK
jgi:hypothetical protein